MQIGYLSIQYIFHAQQAGKFVSAFPYAADDFRYRHPRAFRAFGTDHHFSRVRNIEETGSPAVNAVQFGRILYTPGLQRMIFRQILPPQKNVGCLRT